MAAGGTYEPIASTTLNTNTSTVTFSNISGSYTDLVLVVLARTNKTTGVDDLRTRFNSDTGSNYSRTRFITSAGGAVYTDRAANNTSITTGALACDSSSFAASTFTPYVFNINDYSNATTYKTILMRYSESQDNYGVGQTVALYRSTSAITAIEFASGSASSFVSGSTFTLYGIAAA